MNPNDAIRDLAAALLSGDHQAFAAMRQRLERLVWRTVSYLLPDRHAQDIEDVTQEVWLKVYTKRALVFAPNVHWPVAYILSIAENQAKMFLRHTPRTVIKKNDQAGASNDSLDVEDRKNALLIYAEQQAVKELLEALPEKDADIVRLKMAGYSVGEITQQLDLTLGSYQHRMRTIQQALLDNPAWHDKVRDKQ